MENILIPVSLGELVDKYTILLIKEKKIADVEKLTHVRKEKEALEPFLKNFPHKHYLRYLYLINDEIWSLSDEIRDHSDPQKCVDIIIHNDRRFRVKNKINTASVLKEQKSYPKKSVMLFLHTEAGDTLTNIGIVRYMSTKYDETIVPMKNCLLPLARALYADDSTVKVVSFDDIASEGIYPIYGEPHRNALYVERMKRPDLDIICVYSMGIHYPTKSICNFWDHFYTDAGLDPSVRFSYNYIPRDPVKELEVKNQFVKEPYIFAHSRGDGLLRIPPTDLTIFSVNDGPGRDILILHFAKMIEDAEEIHVENSSFFCFCNYLDLSRVKKLVLYQKKDNFALRGYCHPDQKWEIIQ